MLLLLLPLPSEIFGLFAAICALTSHPITLSALELSRFLESKLLELTILQVLQESCGSRSKFFLELAHLNILDLEETPGERFNNTQMRFTRVDSARL